MFPSGSWPRGRDFGLWLEAEVRSTSRLRPNYLQEPTLEARGPCSRMRSRRRGSARGRHSRRAHWPGQAEPTGIGATSPLDLRHALHPEVAVSPFAALLAFPANSLARPRTGKVAATLEAAPRAFVAVRRLSLSARSAGRSGCRFLLQNATGHTRRPLGMQITTALPHAWPLSEMPGPCLDRERGRLFASSAHDRAPQRREAGSTETVVSGAGPVTGGHGASRGGPARRPVRCPAGGR